MNKKTFLVPCIGFLAAALALSGCSKEGDTPADSNLGSEIRLTSGVQVQSRAGTAPDTQIANGERVAVYVDEATSPAAQLYGNNVLTADGNGGFSGSTAMYFPASGKNVDIYAFHTNATLAEAFPTSIEHSVAADQTGGYASSDLLYAARKGVKHTTSAVDLTFHHLLAKVDVTLIPGKGLKDTDLAGAVVTIENTRLKATFTPDKTVTMTDPSARAAMVKPAENNNDAASVKILTATASNLSASAVIVPQTLATGTKFIKVTLANGNKLSYKLTAETTFGSGKKHQYAITVNLTELTVTSGIDNWNPVGSVYDEATMPGPIGDKTPAQAAVGDFYMNDGTLVGKDETLTPMQKDACIGIVYWVGNPTNTTDGDPLLGTAGHHPDCTHGLVAALHDAGENSLWSSGYEDITNEWLSKQSGNPYGISSLKEQKKMHGYANTKALEDYNAAKGDGSKLRVLPIDLIGTYATTHPAPVNSSSWYWPSVMELKYMCWGQNKGLGVAGRNMLNTQLDKLGIPSLQSYYYYWSSTENGSNNVWDVYFGQGYVDSTDKGYLWFRVRAVLAF
jgi:hypothetical protein